MPFPLAVVFLHIIRHFGERSSGKENLIDAFPFHFPGIVVCNRTAPTPKYRNVVCPFFLQLANDIGKKLDVAAVVTGNPDCSHVLLNGSTYDIADIAMEPKINHLDPMPDELQINGVNGAIMPIADRDRGEDTNR